MHQTTRGSVYQDALDHLVQNNLAYACACTRQAIQAQFVAMGVQPTHGEAQPYPGLCRDGLRGKVARAWRARVAAQPDAHVQWQDRRLGAQQQNVGHVVGDFVLKRADGPWAYQLAVVVDDAAQGVTHVVRGDDLADNTARQVLLQRRLGFVQPCYLHLPLVLDAQGHKLSKSHGAAAVSALTPIEAVSHLQQAAAVLGLPRIHAPTPAAWLVSATTAWHHRYALAL